MGRGAWRATVPGVSRVRHDLGLQHRQQGPLICPTERADLLRGAEGGTRSLERHVGPLRCAFPRWPPAAVRVGPRGRLPGLTRALSAPRAAASFKKHPAPQLPTN